MEGDSPCAAQHKSIPCYTLQAGSGPDTTRVNVSHVIHHMAFGERYPGQANPLDGFSRIVDVDSGTFKYFLKLVPTTYISPRGTHLHHHPRQRITTGAPFDPSVSADDAVVDTPS